MGSVGGRRRETPSGRGRRSAERRGRWEAGGGWAGGAGWEGAAAASRAGPARGCEARRRDVGPMDERWIVAALQRFKDLWDALYPAEQARIIRLLVEKITIGPSGMAVDLRNKGIATLVRELGDSAHLEAAE